MTQTRTPGPEALLRDEARERVRLISEPAYTVALDLTLGDMVFGSRSTIEFTCTEEGASTFVDLTGPSAEAITLNGREIDPDAFTGHRILLDGLVRGRNTLEVTATCQYSRSGTGLHMFRDPIDKEPYLHTQFEEREAHKVFACFDQPDIKGTFSFTVKAPADWVVVSNMAVTGRPAEGAAGDWAFERTPVMSTYITAIVAGPYHSVHDRHGDIDLGIYCRRSLAKYLDPDEIFQVTKQGFDFFADYFDYPYPFGKYDQLFVPEFNAGAMENAGCVTFNETYVFRSKVTDNARQQRAQTILHEMAHMWFGDLVTMRWWDDLWLNESFATYMATVAEHEATRWKDIWVWFSRAQKLWAMIQDQLPTTHPIVADIPDTEATRMYFDGISYAKGASVLRQLVAWVGADAFRDGLRAYMRTYEYRNADLQAFLGALEESSGRDLSAWSKEWLETAGLNTFRAALETDGDAYRSVTLEQTAIAEQPTIRSHRIAVGLYDLRDGALVLRKRVELDAVGPATEVTELAGERVADLVLPNQDDLTFCKVRLDQRSLETLRDHLRALPDPLARVLCWTASADQLRDAEMAAGDYFRLVLNNVAVETDPGTVQQLLGQAASAIVMYGDPSRLAERRLELATRALSELHAAEPGSDLQLIWARVFIGNARSDEHLAIVRGLLDGDVPFESLEVDTDVRWQIVHTLAGLGVVGDAVIAAELERDPSDRGERAASAAFASRPTAEAKAEAWEKILDPETTLAMIRATISGFSRYDQAHLIEAYVEPFFEQLRPIFDSRPVEVTMAFVNGMYPDVIVTPATVERTERYLAEPGHPPVISRYLLENKDSLERVLRARALDIRS